MHAINKMHGNGVRRTARLSVAAALLPSMVGCTLMHAPSAPTYNEKMLKQQEAKRKAGEDPLAELTGAQSGDPLQSSLWAKSVGTPDIIRNQKAQKVGDLLTVVVDENATATTTADTTAKKDNKINLSGTLSTGQADTPQNAGLAANTENKSEFTGSGQTDRTGKFQTTVQASVEEVLPNGTLFVRGKKAITINNEDQELIVSGFVRPDDIRINNTVISTVMANAEIRYTGKGVVSDKQHSGWGTRLLDAIWPF